MQALIKLIDEQESRLSFAEFKVAAYVYRHGTVEILIGELARATGVSVRQTQVALKSLAAMKLILIDGPRRARRRYRVPDGADGSAEAGTAQPVASEIQGRSARVPERDGVGDPLCPEVDHQRPEIAAPEPVNGSTAEKKTINLDEEIIARMTQLHRPPDPATLRWLLARVPSKERLLACLEFLAATGPGFDPDMPGLLAVAVEHQCGNDSSAFAKSERRRKTNDPLAGI